MPEIPEQQLAELRNIDAFVRRGLQNPKTRRKILEVQKTLNPETPVPEIDESEPLRQELADIRGELAKDREERAKAESDRVEQARLTEMTAQWRDGQTFARKKGYADDGLKKLESFMEDKGIPSHEVAIPYFEKQNPPPVQATNSGSRWDFFGNQPAEAPDLKQLFDGQEDAWLNQTVADTLNRVRNAV